ncbi:hypothetical protein ACFOY2_41585 [Nonomuraea purpurea]|uniref:Uncharacterized protein n=1 Tax=Nonomuraea purpurea TaxID=1849276 RepID=A0ABV8GM29_9ACTN
MAQLSRAVLNDIADLRSKGLTPGQIAGEIGANIVTITEAIDYLDREGSPQAETASVSDEAIRLGQHHSVCRALLRVEFFDAFDLNIDDFRDGYSADALYHMYLRSRIRTRMRDS